MAHSRPPRYTQNARVLVIQSPATLGADEPEVPLILTTNKEKTNATWKTEYKQHYTESQANVKKQRNMENDIKENTAIVNTSRALWPIKDINVPREMKTLGAINKSTNNNANHNIDDD
ncbi:hypothetical protein DPMN_058023 [Dreissena polymorpha]|uniref:Uncharacterized protein n=1 Tax=Dreissena polymorpha TaxID=45954 RepID=A0A9D4C111_DREPO|nr:hypothetical protein DPMN_058023 [Dreissena polymorpha]